MRNVQGKWLWFREQTEILCLFILGPSKLFLAAGNKILFPNLLFFRLSSCCNHVAAVVLQLDYISRKEPYKKSCTDGECNWKRSTKNVSTPRCLTDLTFIKPDYKKGRLTFKAKV